MARPKSLGLSVVMATYNEENNLGKCLEAVVDIADEIIIVDGQSSDETVRIAQKFHAQVILTTNKPMFHTNKQMAIDAARGKWVLQLDADEVVDATLKESLITIVREDSAYNAFYINRKNYFLGKFLTKGGQYPDRVIRFFRRGKAYLPQQNVHEQMTVDGEIGVLAGHILHFNAPTFSRYIKNANRYTSLSAHRLKREGIKLNLFNDFKYLMCQPLATFAGLYFRHRGYVDGFPGFVFAMFSGLHHAISYMKLGDLYRDENSN
jgi:glycosyltransferase involved in cell wall biosynthesis